MGRPLTSLCILVAVTLLSAPDAVAHHSIAAEFDADDPITLAGTIKEVVWMSPHISVFVEVPQADGETLTYEVQGGPPNRLFRNGARMDDLKPGDPVIVEGARARNAESLRVGEGRFRTPDGRAVWDD